MYLDDHLATLARRKPADDCRQPDLQEIMQAVGNHYEGLRAEARLRAATAENRPVARAMEYAVQALDDLEAKLSNGLLGLDGY